MSNVPYLAAHRDKRASKIEAFELIKKASNGAALGEVELAALYSYFLPPPPKKVKSAFDWATLACDDKSTYAFCKYVNVAGGVLSAANTRAAHIVFSTLGLDSGWFDPYGGAVGPDVAIMPDVLKALSESCAGSAVDGFDLASLEIVDTPTGLSYVLPWCGRGVNKQYFDMMFGALEGPTVTADLSGGVVSFTVSGVVHGHAVAAVVMPFELPEYA